MEKRFAYLIALLLTLLSGTTYYATTELSDKGFELIEIQRVIDGDTIVDLQDRTIRLLNINAPEKNLETSKEATQYLQNLQGQTLELEITGQDKYQRLLGRIYFEKEYVNLKLVEEGLASKFLVEKSELSDFDNAEKEAIEKQKGIWKTSQHSSCIQTQILPKEEIVQISNSCSDLSLKSWSIKDESRKIYTFDDINIDKIQLHSTSGEDNETDIYWNERNIWNNDRDTLYLFDSSSNLANHNSYGY